MEAADDGTARIAELGDPLEGPENDLAGASRGAEQSRERLAQEV